MHTSIDLVTLRRYLRATLENAFPPTAPTFDRFEAVLDQALARTEACFSHVAFPGYQRDGKPFFNHLHGDQSAIFYYFAANSAFQLGEIELAARFFLLNKMRNGFVCMYDTTLPEIFLLVHTVGTVLGKAAYANYFVAYQNVTVGTGRDLTPPSIEEHVVIYGGSMILGKTHLGRGSIVSANSHLMDETVPPDSVVVGRSPDLAIKARRSDFDSRFWIA